MFKQVIKSKLRIIIFTIYIMIYNLFLNAYTNATLTNYYSATTATEYAQRVFAID